MAGRLSGSSPEHSQGESRISNINQEEDLEVEIEKPKKLENLTEQDIQDWVRWALEQANKINQEEETK